MMKPNQQYNLAPPDSLPVRVATRVRMSMFDTFMRTITPDPAETVLDLGVTGDQSYTSSNYFEALYPWKDRITAAGIDDASFLEQRYPGLTFVHADALDMPFPDGSFDLIHSSAVLEHVGSLENQARMVAECLRVARRGIFLTTPNRWFPIEFHTQLPLIHWLPKPAGRAVFRLAGMEFFAKESNLNLMTHGELELISKRHPEWAFSFPCARLLGWVSNLILVAVRRPTA